MNPNKTHKNTQKSRGVVTLTLTLTLTSVEVRTDSERDPSSRSLVVVVVVVVVVLVLALVCHLPPPQVPGRAPHRAYSRGCCLRVPLISSLGGLFGFLVTDRRQTNFP